MIVHTSVHTKVINVNIVVTHLEHRYEELDNCSYTYIYINIYKQFVEFRMRDIFELICLLACIFIVCRCYRSCYYTIYVGLTQQQQLF